MEVLFAIGVLMVGLLGIAAVLPVGTRNATGALRSDIAAAAIENQISGAIGRLGGRPEAFDFPVPSQSAVTTGTGAASGLSSETRSGEQGRLFLRRTIRDADSFVPRVADPVPGGTPAPMVAPAFCIDPAFLAAANNLRNDAGNAGSRALNSYDRTKFPCFDVNYHPAAPPGLAMSVNGGWPMTPRMYRVSLNPNVALAAPPSAVAKVLLSERDGLPLTKPKDASLPPSLLFSAIGAADRLDAQRSGAFSSMVLLAPTNASATSYDVSVVVFEGRQLTTNIMGLETTNLADVFPLTPFPATPAWTEQETAAPNSRTYGEEVMGVVTSNLGDPGLIDVIHGGSGQFDFVQSATCNPEIKIGQWLMLARWDSAAGVNRYGWYQVSEVVSTPTLGAFAGQSVYRTRVEVRGADWLFHPLMVTPLGTLIPHPDLGSAGPIPRRLATIVVKMPKVVMVRSMTL